MKRHLNLSIIFSLIVTNIYCESTNASVKTNKEETTNKTLLSSIPPILAQGDTLLLQGDDSSITQKKKSRKQNAPSHTSSEVFLCSPFSNFELQGSVLLLQPTGSSLHYAAEANPIPVPSPNWEIHDIDTDYHCGFELGMRGNLHNTNSNITLDWQHYHSTDSSSKKVSSENMIGPFFEIGPDATPYKKAHGKVNFHFDEGHLTYGIFLNLGNRLQTNLFSGISVAYIKQKLHTKFSNADETVTRTIKVPSTFIGAGPQVGMDFSYCIVKGFHFTGGLSASLLVGNQKNHTTYEATAPSLATLGITPPNEQRTTVHKKSQVVPGLEAKLGLSYVFTWCDHYQLKLEAGYEAQTYINAIRSIDMGSEVITPPIAPDITGVYARTFEENVGNFSLAGPYFMLNLGF